MDQNNSAFSWLTYWGSQKGCIPDQRVPTKSETTDNPTPSLICWSPPNCTPVLATVIDFIKTQWTFIFPGQPHKIRATLFPFTALYQDPQILVQNPPQGGCSISIHWIELWLKEDGGGFQYDSGRAMLLKPGPHPVIAGHRAWACGDRASLAPLLRVPNYLWQGLESVPQLSSCCCLQPASCVRVMVPTHQRHPLHHSRLWVSSTQPGQEQAPSTAFLLLFMTLPIF